MTRVRCIALYLALAIGATLLTPLTASPAFAASPTGYSAPPSCSPTPVVLNDRAYVCSIGFGNRHFLASTDGTSAGTHTVYPPESSTELFVLDELTRVGNSLFFVGFDEVHGAELWRSDGTTEGTKLVKDINPGTNDSLQLGSISGLEIADLNGVAYFAADDGVHGDELWRSDGTSEGTSMVKNVAPDETSRSGAQPRVRVALNRVWFSGDDGTHGTEPWTSDGTANGTVLLKDIKAGADGSSPNGFVALNGAQVLLSAFDNANGGELWRSDGTANGTVLVEDINPGAAMSIDGFGTTFAKVADGLAVFAATDGSTGNELWRTDGTAANTQLVKDINPGAESSTPRPVALGNSRVVMAATDPQHGVEPWGTDGTANGTVLLVDTNPGSGGGVPRVESAAGSGYFLGGSDSSLWRTDGTIAGTKKLGASPALAGARGFIAANGLLVFIVSNSTKPFARFGTPPIVTVSGASEPVGAAGFARNGSEMQRLSPYGAFSGGASVAQGDINGDGVLDTVIAAGPGGGPHVQVLSGADDTVLRSFYAYPADFTGGVFVGSGDYDGDGKDDIVTGAGPGGGPHVQVFSGANNSVLRSFYAYAPAFSGGVRVCLGNVDGDGRMDIVTAAGPGGGPHVQALSGTDNAPLKSFYAFDPAFAAGVHVACGRFDDDSKADIAVGADAGGGPHVRVFAGAGNTVLKSFYAYDPAFTGGARVALADIDGDGLANLMTAAGAGGGPHVLVFGGTLASTVRTSFFAYPASFTGGVFPASTPSK
ncbi:MAG TPA: ELWxxDGT repeat protein [Acidimicrobiales bacterium]|nr:ELWxxDGT repeat protein [Acidimicrobiales bacterium]